MSAITPEGDRLLRSNEVTLCAISDQSALRQNTSLFDHLVGGVQQADWHSETHRFRRLEVDR